MRALACAKDGHAVARMEARLEPGPTGMPWFRLAERLVKSLDVSQQLQQQLDFKSELESQKERKQGTCSVFCIS